MNQQESGIDQLIQRVKSEAIDKAKIEREEILKIAEREAEAIINDAKSRAEALLKNAHDHLSLEERKFTKELELAARDFVVKLAERLKEQMFFPAIKEGVRATLKEPDYLKEVLQKLIIDYLKENPCNLDILVPKELRTTLAAFFASSIFDQLDKKCEIRLLDEDGVEGFVLIKRGEHYVWDFRAETIAQELMRLIDPNLRKYFVSQGKLATPEIETQSSAMVC